MAIKYSAHVGLASIAIGLPLAGRLELTVLVAVAIAIGATATRAPKLGVAAAVLACCASAAGEARVATIDHSEIRDSIGHHVELRGYLTKRERSSFGTRRMRVELVGSGEQIQLRVPKQVRLGAVSIGDQLAIAGELADLPRTKPGQFDYRGYLWRAGVHAVLRADAVRSTDRRRAGFTGFVDSIRRRAEAGVVAGIDPPLSQLALGMVLGEDEQIPDAMSDDFKDSGLAHVLAVSGQNVMLLALLTWALLGLVRVGRRARLLTTLTLIAIYVPLTGAGPSIQRAGVMGAATIVAGLSGRPASRWYALLASAAVTLALDPRAWQDVGWQLSFAAVAGIFLLMAPLTRWLRRVPATLREGLAMTIAATLATAPLMAFHFGRVSIASLLANVLALPAIAPVMWAGMLASLLAQLSIALVMPVNALSSYCLAFVAAVAHWSAGLPGAVAIVKLGSLWLVAGIYGLLGLLVWAMRARGGRHARPPVLALVAVAITIAIVVWPHGSATSLPDGFSATFIDVGQGDAILLRTPRGSTVLIDGGIPEADVAGKLDDLGVKRLDVVVLTHPERDHQGGLLAVLQRMKVGLLLDGGRGAPSAEHRAIVAVARQRGVDITNPRAGARYTLDGLRLRVLSPQRAYDAGAAPPNDQATVLLASYAGFDMLLPADAESNATGALQLPRVELLKVAHHGSADEGLATQLNQLRPQIAVIEVGAGNTYGHPTAATLTALRAVPQVYRTDRHGNVTVMLTPDGPRVRTE